MIFIFIAVLAVLRTQRWLSRTFQWLAAGILNYHPNKYILSCTFPEFVQDSLHQWLFAWGPSGLFDG